MIRYEHDYGVLADERLPQWRVELQAFLDAPYPGSLTKYEHARNTIRLVYPEVAQPNSWNPWLERALQAFCNEKYAVRRRNSVTRTIVLTGCAAANKTFSSALYTVLWWLAAPFNSLAYFTSTSKPMIRRRSWPIIQRFCQGGICNAMTGEWVEFGANVVDSKTVVQAVKGDDKHSISALAVAQGETQKAVAKLSGQHAERILLVIDEAQGTPQAIFETIPNLRKGCRDLTIIIIENPISRLTCSGRASEPEGGWKTVGEQTEQWVSKGVADWQLEKAMVVRFDGAKSPNVLAGVDYWPFLYTCADWEAANDGRRKGTLSYYIQDRGLSAPDGVGNTVFTEQLVERCEGYGQFIFLSRKRVIAFLDPGFGGDACVLQFAEIGDIEGGREGIQLTETIEIPIDIESAVEIERQVGKHVMNECKRRGVRPEDFGVYATGTGRGIHYAITEIWSPLIHRVEEGGLPSELPASADDPRPSKEVYDRKVTELWWTTREFLMAEQMKGFSVQAVTEFSKREYTYVGRKYSIETKQDMKVKMGYSPDHADTVAGICEVARRQGFELYTRMRMQSERAVEDRIEENRIDPEDDASESEEGGWAESSIIVQVD